MSVKEPCGTGCMNEKHMITCQCCGLEFHFGTMHFCPTGIQYKFTSSGCHA